MIYQLLAPPNPAPFPDIFAGLPPRILGMAICLLFTLLALVYVFVVKDEVPGAVSPLQGDLDWVICAEMNVIRIGGFLSRVAHAHPDEFIVIILDGASLYKAKDLAVPENIGSLAFLAYASERNPQKRVPDEFREKESPKPCVQPHGHGHRTTAQRLATPDGGS